MLAGALILGIGGRLVMAGVAALLGRPMNLSAHGFTIALALGTGLGGLTALLAHLIRPGGAAKTAPALVAALAGFMLTMLLATSLGNPLGMAATGIGVDRVATLTAAGLVFVGYGLALPPLVRRAAG